MGARGGSQKGRTVNRPKFEKGYKRTRLIQGFGVNDADYSLGNSKGDTKCPIHKKWLDMIYRCYRPKNEETSYRDKTVSVKWKHFSGFKVWADTQVFTKEMDLDKDILVKGNKEYGPDTCAFVPDYVNLSISGFKSKEINPWPIGVHWSTHLKGRPFESMCWVGDKRKRLGRFATPEEAHAAWQLGKAEALEFVINRYAQEECFRTDVADALMRRVWDLRLDNANGVETKSL